MRADLRELYQETILDHSKKPRNFRDMPEATGQAQGYNPLCGDKATVYVDDLDSPVAVACWDGGVFVGDVPDLWYFKDTNGDG